MAMLSSRLEKLEGQLPKEERPGRVIRITVDGQDEEQTRKMLEAEGFDPERGDFAIIRRIVSPPPIPPLPPRAVG